MQMTLAVVAIAVFKNKVICLIRDRGYSMAISILYFTFLKTNPFYSPATDIRSKAQPQVARVQKELNRVTGVKAHIEELLSTFQSNLNESPQVQHTSAYKFTIRT